MRYVFPVESANAFLCEDRVLFPTAGLTHDDVRIANRKSQFGLER
jgi:hypothetical protein